MGCAMAQGPFLGRPTPVEAVETLFHAELPTGPASAPADLSAAGASAATQSPAAGAGSAAQPGMAIDS